MKGLNFNAKVIDILRYNLNISANIHNTNSTK